MKNKRSFLSLIFLCCFGLLHAQGDFTVSAIAMGGNTQNGIWACVGQLFAQQTFQNGYEVAAGVSQAQVVDSTYTEESCENEDYDGHGFHFSAPLSVGEHTANMYVVAGHQYHYDLRKHLTLSINPTFEMTTYVTYPNEFPDGIHSGWNDLNLLTIKGCDSLVHLYADLCPFEVTDIDLNTYHTVVVGNYCWMQSNLAATHYSDSTEISKALVYSDILHPNTNSNLATYGRLYTWFSAVRTPEGSSVAPAVDNLGFVQGVCPDGWHIPTVVERATLETVSAEDLRTSEFWVAPNNNTNSTGFTALPAGKFNAALNRFEGLGTQTDWWMDAVTQHPTSLLISYFCDTPQSFINNTNDALSVRCVKDHVQMEN